MSMLGELKLIPVKMKSREVTRNSNHVLFMGFDIGTITTG